MRHGIASLLIRLSVVIARVARRVDPEHIKLTIKKEES